ncbi:MAG TPA: hypothetical protein VF337_01870 [Candidatus Limnocylindrales bacterium]
MANRVSVVAAVASLMSWVRSTKARVPVIRLVLFVLTGLAVAMGVLLRVSLLGSGSPWLDELWTLDAVSRSFTDMARARLVSDQSPPLWTTLTWVWLHLVGTYDAASMRTLAAAFSCFGVAAPIVGAIRMPSLRPTLLVMASLLASSLFVIQYGVELRAYSMMIGLGAAATVVWVGLLTSALPRSRTWIFAFALVGALAGFGHYYGNILYASELLILLAMLAYQRDWAPARFMLTWGALSLIPVAAWSIATSRWMPNQAVASPPSFFEIQTWFTYAFAPVTNVLANDPPGYPDGARGNGVVFAVLIVVSIVAAIVWYALPRNRRTTRIPPAAAAGASAILVVVIGLCVAWSLSLIRPPSMNVRNLAALLPALFLATACACTLLPVRARWVTASIAVAGLVAANGIFVSNYGVAALAPPWQQQAGYRDAARILISASHESPRPTLIGLNTTWAWHGQWDAAIHAELGAGPAVPSDPEPLAVHWIDDVQNVDPNGMLRGPLLVFSDTQDQRTDDLFAWAERTVGSCTQSTVGGPAYGIISLLRCG